VSKLISLQKLQGCRVTAIYRKISLFLQFFPEILANFMFVFNYPSIYLWRLVNAASSTPSGLSVVESGVETEDLEQLNDNE
jgi:hypothetical protein